MHSFKNDYSEGAHPYILQRLVDTNLTQQEGYGEDEYSLQAKKILREKMGTSNAEIFFLSGGTQTNLIALSFLLRPHEAVISAGTGHIAVNETGAIEATGHKVITVDKPDGKLTPTDVEAVVAAHHHRPHVVKPRGVYISNATELGGIYSKAELQALHTCCRQMGLLLFLDGARLGHALTAETNDVTLAEVAQLTDVFYIGGTKNGALLGEALVFPNRELATDFAYSLKQKGALLAKGRLLGIQFLALFEEDLFFDLAKRANRLAGKIAAAITAKDWPFLVPPASNQLFPILPITAIAQLEKNWGFYVWRKIDDEHAAIRIITSWATEERVVDAFIRDIEQL
jgi:threonine aldolase